MAYKILRTLDIEEMELAVEARELNDWKCQGGVSIAVNGPHTLYCQAMVKEK